MENIQKIHFDAVQSSSSALSSGNHSTTSSRVSTRKDMSQLLAGSFPSTSEIQQTRLPLRGIKRPSSNLTSQCDSIPSPKKVTALPDSNRPCCSDNSLTLSGNSIQEDITEAFLEPIWNITFPRFDNADAKLAAPASLTGDVIDVLTQEPTQLVTTEDIEEDTTGTLSQNLTTQLASAVEQQDFFTVEAMIAGSRSAQIIQNILDGRRSEIHRPACRQAVIALAYLKKIEQSLGRHWHTKVLETNKNNSRFTALYQKLLQLEQTVAPMLGTAQLAWLQQQHTKAPSHPEVVIEGAGPIGLLMSLKAYQAGARVTVVEQRDSQYSRMQIVRLDPLWMKTLRFYLPEQFHQLFFHGQGHSKVETDGSGHILLKELEAALANRLQQLISYTQTTGAVRLLTGHKVVGCQMQPDESNYAVQIQNKTGENLALAADLAICAGGKNSTLRNQLFRHCPVTEEKPYAVCTWQGTRILNQNLQTFRSIQDLSFHTRASFSDSFSKHLLAHIHPVTGALVRKMSTALLRECAAICGLNLDDLPETLEDHQQPTLHGEERKAFISNVKALSEIDDEHFRAHHLHRGQYLEMRRMVVNDPTQLRTFENQQTIYLGMELPKAVNTWYQQACQRLDKLVNENEATDEQTTLIKKQMKVAWLQSVADQYYLDQRGAGVEAIQPESMALFPVAQEVNNRAEIVIGSESNRPLRVVPVGDACVTPHFMTASGLSGGRETVEAVTQLICQMAKAPTTNSIELKKADQQLRKSIQIIHQFVLSRGQEFLSPLTKEQCQASWQKAAIKEMKTVLETNQHRLIQNSENSFSLHLSKGQPHQLTITPWGALSVSHQQKVIGVYASFGHLAASEEKVKHRDA